MSDTILLMSSVADFYPEELEDASPRLKTGNFIRWTFLAPRKAPVGAGIYRLEFVRAMTREERDDPLFIPTEEDATNA